MGANTGCKTRLVRKHVLDTFDDRYITTLGTKVSKRGLRLAASSAGTPFHVDLLIWDILSQRGFRFPGDAYYHGARGVVAVSDMTRRKTLDDLDDWIRSVEAITGTVPVAIVGANYDRADGLQVTEEEIARAAQAHDAPYFLASEDAGEGVEAAFLYLAKRVIESLLRSPGDD